MKRLSAPVALTIGNFDGVHRGHQDMIRSLVDMAQKQQLQSAVLCFEPHPDIVFATPGFELLMNQSAKIEHLQALGVDHLIFQNFNADFAQVSAEDFLRQYLQSFFNLSLLFFGYDFRFGHQGEGDFAMAKQFFSKSNISVLQGEPLVENGHTLSSTWVRELLKSGQARQACQVLGRPYQLSGIVEEGKRLGRTLGFPTANLGQIQTLIPGRGVYHCRINWGEKSLWSVVNIGERPTVAGDKITVEAHILDFSGDLYGQSVDLLFFRKIRDEKKFENLDRLKEQIEKDIQNLKDNLACEKLT